MRYTLRPRKQLSIKDIREERVLHQSTNTLQLEYYGCLIHERQIVINETNSWLCYSLIQFLTNRLGFMEHGINLMPFEGTRTSLLLNFLNFFQKQFYSYFDISLGLLLLDNTPIYFYRYS